MKKAGFLVVLVFLVAATVGPNPRRRDRRRFPSR